tara:strand:- start:575 stop:820 length:246 start_codon:yes stop_codon:yes gene_type:complete
MASYPEKYDFGGKPSTFGYKTTFGPGGYTVFRVVTDSAGDIYNSSIADFKYRVHAELFLKALRNKNEQKTKTTKKSAGAEA